MKSFREYLEESELLIMEMRGFEYQNSKYTIGVTKDGEYSYWKDGKEISEPQFKQTMEKAGVKDEKKSFVGKLINRGKMAFSKTIKNPPKPEASTRETASKLGDALDKVEKEYGEEGMQKFLDNLEKKNGWKKSDDGKVVKYTSPRMKDDKRITMRFKKGEGGKVDVINGGGDIEDLKPTKDTAAYKKRAGVMSHVNMMYGPGDIEGERDAEDYLKSEGYKKEESKSGSRFTSEPFKDGSRMRVTVKNDKHGHPDWRNADYEVVQDD